MFIPWLVIELLSIAALFAYAIVYFALVDEYAKDLQVSSDVIIVTGVVYLLVMSKFYKERTRYNYSQIRLFLKQ